MSNSHVGKHYHKGQKAWNKGLTKDTDERMKVISEKVSETLKGNIRNKGLSKKKGGN